MSTVWDILGHMGSALWRITPITLGLTLVWLGLFRPEEGFGCERKTTYSGLLMLAMVAWIGVIFPTIILFRMF